MLKRYLTRIISVVSLLLLIGAGVGLVVFQTRGGQFMSVQTGSMEPNVKKGSLVAMSRAPTDEIKQGDIITYMNPADRSQTITHRVVGTMPSLMSGGRPYLITKGDANEAADQPIQESMVLGKVKASIPYAGYLIDQLRKPLGLIAAIYLPALVIIIHEIRRLSRYYAQMQRYRVNEVHAQEQPALKLPTSIVAAVLSAGILVFGVSSAQAALQSKTAMTGNAITSTTQNKEALEEEEKAKTDQDHRGDRDTYRRRR